MEEYIETIVRYQCLGMEVRVSRNKVIQAIDDRLYREGLIPGQIHGTGSWWEGLPLEVCNDVDHMIMPEDSPIVVHQQPDVAPPQGFLIFEINPSNPAYLTLRTVPGVEYESTSVQGSIQQSGNHGYLSSSRFVTDVFRDADIQEKHGPAGVGMLDSTRPEYGTVDRVPCLSCPSWPPSATEFLTRPRHHGWPPLSLIDKIQQAGCHVVPVGHPQSENKEIEWRWSFSVAEKELIHENDDKMYMVMTVLKLMKSFLWEDDNSEGPTIFCSYFIKTACLWVCEETDQSNISVIYLCRKVINWLVTCYRTHKLPHYFIHAQNLIGHLDEHMCNICRAWLQNVEINLDVYIPSVLQTPVLKHYCKGLLHIKTNKFNERDIEDFELKMKELKSGGLLYNKKCRFWFTEASDSGDAMSQLLLKKVRSGDSLLEVASIPEKILLPVMNDLQSIVKVGYQEMYKTHICRKLGDTYMCLYFYAALDVFQALGTSDYGQIREMLHKMCIAYYKQGLEMVYPDGWSDRGLGGFIRLASFYHLNGEREKLGETLQKLQPLLRWGKHITEINPIEIQDLWQADGYIYDNLITIDTDIIINPVILGYYLQARYISDGREQNEPIRYQPSIFRAFCVWCEEIISNLVASQNIHYFRREEFGYKIVKLIDNLDPY